MNCEWKIAYTFMMTFVLSLVFFVFMSALVGPPFAKHSVPANCVVDYYRDGIHYCILEGK